MNGSFLERLKDLIAAKQHVINGTAPYHAGDVRREMETILADRIEDIVALVEALEAIATDSGYVPVQVDDDDPEPLEYALAKIMLYRMKAKQALRNLEAKP